MAKQSHTQVQNKVLYEKYRDFTIASLKVLDKCLEEEKSIPTSVTEDVSITKKGSFKTFYRYEPAFHQFIRQCEKKVSQLPEFISCIGWMLQDPVIKKPRVTDSEGKIVKNPDYKPFLERELTNFLIKFVERKKSFKFNLEEFNEFYKEFEESLYTDVMKFKELSPLKNFRCEVDEIDLGNSLKIRRISSEEREEMLRESISQHSFSFIPSHQVLSLEYFLEMPYEIKKGEPISDQIPREISNKVVSALRLFKGGVVGADVVYSAPLGWSSMGKSASSGLSPKQFFGPHYMLKKSEVKKFKEFWGKFRDVDIAKYPFLDIAIRRFNYGCERENPEDKLIDYITALEALYVKEKQELNYRLSIRVATLLGKSNKDKQKIFFDIKKAYNLRSKIIHGLKYESEIKVNESKVISLKEFALRVEAHLRESIKNFLNLTERYNHTKIFNLLDESMFNDKFIIDLG